MEKVKEKHRTKSNNNKESSRKKPNFKFENCRNFNLEALFVTFLLLNSKYKKLDITGYDPVLMVSTCATADLEDIVEPNFSLKVTPPPPNRYTTLSVNMPLGLTFSPQIASKISTSSLSSFNKHTHIYQSLFASLNMDSPDFLPEGSTVRPKL